MAKRVIIGKFKYMFEVVRVCSFVCCDGVYKVELKRDTIFDQTQGNLMLRLLMPLNSFGFCCSIYHRNVQMQINCKDLTIVYSVEGLRD